MGLDMWFFVDTDERDEDGEIKQEEIHYWRKHNALHGWFEERAIREGLVSNPSDFNCVPLPLTQELLDDLERDIIEGNLVPEAGCFFGPTDYDPREDMEDDLAAVAKARMMLDNGKAVYYNSWW